VAFQDVAVFENGRFYHQNVIFFTEKRRTPQQNWGHPFLKQRHVSGAGELRDQWRYCGLCDTLCLTHTFFFREQLVGVHHRTMYLSWSLWVSNLGETAFPLENPEWSRFALLCR